MAMTSVTIGMDEATKRAASDVAEELGFDLSSVTRAFYRQMAREGRIPLSLDLGSSPRFSDLEAGMADGRIAFMGEDARPGSGEADWYLPTIDSLTDLRWQDDPRVTDRKRF